MSDNENGYKFEIFVEKLYKNLGKDNVQRNLLLADRTSNNGQRCQIDLAFDDWLAKRYVECKYYENTSVPFGDVEEFVTKLGKIGAETCQGIMVTNSSFMPSAMKYAKEHGLHLIDGLKLEEIYRKSCLCDCDFIQFIKYKFGKRSLGDEVNKIELKKENR
ncbi:restriction endonuclease [Candidatus Woesearchaeota archaeon]|nr:restriction endonuclease [Candidatus Woesearchaeota archaeon]